MVDMVSQSISTQYLTPVKATSIAFLFEDVIFALALGTIASFAAALWPAFKATKVHPLDAMKPIEWTADQNPRLLTRNFYFGLLCLTYLSISSAGLWGTKSTYLDFL